MTASLPAVQKTWPVGKGYTCHISIPFPADDGKPGAAVVEWQPFVPEELNPQEILEYNQGLYAAMLEYTLITGNAQFKPHQGVTLDAAND